MACVENGKVCHEFHYIMSLASSDLMFQVLQLSSILNVLELFQGSWSRQSR